MKKLFQTLPVLFIICAVFSSCTKQSTNTMQVDVLGADNSSQFYEVYSNKQQLFNKAYDRAQNFYPPEQPVKGVIIAANMSQKETIAGFFKSLEKYQNYDTVVVLGSTNLTTPNADIFTTNYNVKTPYGLLMTDQNLVTAITTQKNIIVSTELIKKNSYLNLLTPFIKKSFSRANFLPIVINSNTKTQDLITLAQLLKTNLGGNTLVIAQNTLKTSSDPQVQSFQLKWLHNVVENFDLSKFSQLPLDQSVTLQTLGQYLTLTKNQKAHNVIPVNQNQQNPALIEYFKEGAPSSSRNVFLVSFGDIMLGRAVRQLMDKTTLDYPFQKMDESYLSANDLLIANLEGPVAQKEIKTGKEIAFRFLPDVVPLLKKYSFDALSSANNHAIDMNWDGYNDTRNLLANEGILNFGNPKEINEQSVATTMIQNRKIAFLGVDDVDFRLDEKVAIAKIKDLVAQGYNVIPFAHWGEEYQHTPTRRQRDLAHAFIDAGALTVIAHHPHVVQTYETYKNRPIFYSLGNGIFDQYFSNDTQEGLSIAMIAAPDQLEIFFLPIKIDISQMRLMLPEERQKFLARFVTYGDYNSEEKQNILDGHLTLALQ